ncbi:MAG TPA: hypothetical protein VL749_03355, partial [Patescibacteria group bacterium]|nr:hypothetical protein [Patescibacteria group bacterium]
MSSRTPLRGRKGWERRLAERTGEPGSVAAPDAPPIAAAAEPTVPPEWPVAVPPGQRPPVPAPASKPGPGRRIPNLSGLPRLLDGTGSFSTLRERLGPPAAPPSNAGRHAGVTSVPHGAKSYLAAALALAAGERICWIARDSE